MKKNITLQSFNAEKELRETLRKIFSELQYIFSERYFLSFNAE